MFIPIAKRNFGKDIITPDDLERKAIYLFIASMIDKWVGDMSLMEKY